MCKLCTLKIPRHLKIVNSNSHYNPGSSKNAGEENPAKGGRNESLLPWMASVWNRQLQDEVGGKLTSVMHN